VGIGGGDEALTAAANARSKRSIALRLIVSITVFVWIASRIEWSAVSVFARNISAGWALAAFAAFLPTLLFNTRRWQLLLHGQNVPLSFRRALELMLVGQFFNAFLIGTTGGDVARAVYLGRAESDGKTAGLSVVVDRLLGAAALSTLVLLIGGVRQRFFAGHRAAETIFIAAMLIAAAVVTLTIAAASPLAERWPRLASWRAPLANRNIVMRAYALSIGGHLVHLFLSYSVVRAVHMPITALTLITISPFVALLASMPISIQGLGIREGVATVLFGVAGVRAELAVLFALGLLLVTLAWSAIGGVIFVARPRQASER
jgi:uncharacterized membrane protein YbhN (UPF0104 family)